MHYYLMQNSLNRDLVNLIWWSRWRLHTRPIDAVPDRSDRLPYPIDESLAIRSMHLLIDPVSAALPARLILAIGWLCTSSDKLRGMVGRLVGDLDRVGWLGNRSTRPKNSRDTKWSITIEGASLKMLFFEGLEGDIVVGAVNMFRGMFPCNRAPWARGNGEWMK